jgi:hypothetical protein
VKTLYPYQEAEVQRALSHDSWFNASEMGLGKTLMSVEWARRKGFQTAIVVCPLNVFETWTREFKSQMPDVPVRYLKNEPGLVGNFAKLNSGERGVYLIGWEMMRTGALTGVTADLVIADETHKQANYGKSLQSILMRHVNGRLKLALSGTPAANKPEGIFATLNWLWPTQYKSYWKWIEHYWRTLRNGAVITLVREITPGQIIRDIPMFTRLLRKDYRDDMPPVLPEIPIPVKLTPAQRKLYDKLSQEAGVWLDNGESFMSTSVALVENMRLREICLAVPTMLDGKVTFKDTSKSSKIDALLEVLTQSGLEDETFLVLTHSAKIVPVVVAKLAAKGIGAAGFTGGSKADLGTFGTQYRVLVAGIAAIGEGTDGLQYKCHNMFWLSKHPNAYLNKQAAMRLDRPGQTEPINTWYTYAEDTTDEDSIERLREIDENLDEMIDNHR